MSVAISPLSVTANQIDFNPQIKTDQAAATGKVNQEVQNSIQHTRTDTLTLSNAAVQRSKKPDFVTTYDRSTQKPVEKPEKPDVTLPNEALHHTAKSATMAPRDVDLARTLKQQGMNLASIALSMGITREAAASLLGLKG